MKTISILLVLTLFTSCLTVNKIKRHCDDFAEVCIVESETVSTTVLKDTTIYEIDTFFIDKIIRVPIPQKDSVNIRDSIRIIDGFAHMQNVHKEAGIIGVDASVKFSKIIIDAYLLDSTLYYNYKDTLTNADSVKIYNAIRNTVINTTNTLEQKKQTPKWAWKLLISNAILLFICIVYLVIRFKKSGLKATINRIVKRE